MGKAKGHVDVDEIRIELPKMNIQTVIIKLVGDSPLISHRWSSKAKTMMLDKQMGKAKAAKEKKDPEKDFKECLYEFPGGGYGFPSIAFKSAAVGACSHVDGVTKVVARGAFHINGELVKIIGKPTPRVDMVRNQTGVADIRYRAEFRKWSAEFEVRHNANVLTAEQVVNLFNTAGFSIGVGDWRPAKNGSYGMFHVE